MKLKGADIVAEILIEQGVDTIFGYPGGANLPIYDAFYERQDKITQYLTADECGAAHAADGYARASGEVGVCFATSGPGATNLVTGIATAFLDSIPMVAITANVDTNLIGKDSFQEVYITGIATPVAKHTYTVRDVNRLASVMRQAFKIAKEGRPGPVLVDIPKNILLSTAEFEPEKKISAKKGSVPSMEKIKTVAEKINAAKRPVLLFGGGTVSSGASDKIAEFVEKSGIPACHTIMATGIIAFGEKVDLGMTGLHGTFAANKALNDADLVIAAGTRLSDRVASGQKTFAPKAEIIQIDVDASEIGKSINSEYALIGDLKAILTKLNPLLEMHDIEDWFKKIEGWKKRGYKPPRAKNKLYPVSIMEIIGEVAGKKTIIATDVGQHQMWAAQYCKNVQPRGFLTSGGLGTMGFGYGAAIGAKLAKPKSTVIHITGDGSFHMNMTEAATAVSYGLKVITVIMDNGILGMVDQLQWAYYGKRYIGTHPYRKTDYMMVGKGFGLNTFMAKTPAQFETALKKAMEADGPSWIVCPIPDDLKVLPMLMGGKPVKDIVMSEKAFD